jgi:hypothetical protein
MKKSSKTGMIGVEIFKGKFRAFYQKGSVRKTIGLFGTIKEAARAFDDFIVEKKGIGLAFPQLNLPTDEHRKSYAEFQAKRLAEVEANQVRHVERLKATPIPPVDYAKLLKLFHSGLSIQELANRFDTHSEVVIAVLRKLEQDRLASIGLGTESEPGIEGDTKSLMLAKEKLSTGQALVNRLFPSKERSGQ